jgi:dipeptidyl aminopeptidase/acylaminoacyl peptidase
VNPLDGRKTRLTDDGLKKAIHSWSPGKNKIAFMLSESLETGYDIWIMNADGTGKGKLTKDGHITRYFGYTFPSWSPDGNSIIYCKMFKEGEGDIWVADLPAIFRDRPTHVVTIDECEQLMHHERDWCYVNEAIATGDKELCKSIFGREIYHYCMRIFDDDLGHCDYIEDAELKEMCLGQLGFGTKVSPD